MMKKSQQSIFDQYPSRMRSLWIQGQPKYLEIDQRIQQSDNEKPIKVRDLSDQLIEKPQYQLINQFLVSSNSFVDCNNLYLKTVYHHEIQGLYGEFIIMIYNFLEIMNIYSCLEKK